jgi:hypothetical protein
MDNVAVFCGFFFQFFLKINNIFVSAELPTPQINPQFGGPGITFWVIPNVSPVWFGWTYQYSY